MGFPQEPRAYLRVSQRLPGRLRSLRKFRGVFRDVCAACASFAAFAETFAQPAQVLWRLPGRLRSLRKFRGVCRGVCAACASLAAFAVAFAQLALGFAAFAEAFAQPAPSLAALTEKRGGTSPQRAAPSLFSQIVGCLPSTLHPLPSIRTSRSACHPFR